MSEIGGVRCSPYPVARKNGKTLTQWNLAEAFAKLQEENAELREIVRELALMNPGGMTEMGECGFCAETWEDVDKPDVHKPDCLWLRAQKWRVNAD